jgi:hypothetical protein
MPMVGFAWSLLLNIGIVSAVVAAFYLLENSDKSFRAWAVLSDKTATPSPWVVFITAGAVRIIAAGWTAYRHFHGNKHAPEDDDTLRGQINQRMNQSQLNWLSRQDVEIGRLQESIERLEREVNHWIAEAQRQNHLVHFYRHRALDMWQTVSASAERHQEALPPPLTELPDSTLRNFKDG